MFNVSLHRDQCKEMKALLEHNQLLRRESSAVKSQNAEVLEAAKEAERLVAALRTQLVEMEQVSSVNVCR